MYKVTVTVRKDKVVGALPEPWHYQDTANRANQARVYAGRFIGSHGWINRQLSDIAEITEPLTIENERYTIVISPFEVIS